MILLSTLLLLITTSNSVVLPLAAPPSAAPASEPDPATLAHLPLAIQHDIQAWRERLQHAACIKVVCNTDESWVNEHDLDESGSPRLVARERFSIHSWMTPDSSWVVIFPYKDDAPDTSRTLFQQYWNARDAKAWERVWDDASGSYTVDQFPSTEPGGPASPHVASRGCIYASAAQSWLAGPFPLSERSITVSSIAFLRHTNLAVVPPDPSLPGVWLDVFRDAIVRNEEKDPKLLYRRNDFMLLARNEQGLPELREWRTIVTSDESSGGLKPQRITGIRRFSYTFYDQPPPELKAATDSFVADINRATRK